MAHQQGFNYNDSYGAGSATRFSGQPWHIPNGGYTGPRYPDHPSLPEAKLALRIVIAFVEQCPKKNLLKDDEKYVLGRLKSVLEGFPDPRAAAPLVFRPPNLSEAELAIAAVIAFTGRFKELVPYTASDDQVYSLWTIKNAFHNFAQGIPYER